MTLPSTTNLGCDDDDSDMFGPPRSSPPNGYHHRSRVPMISPKLRQREERKRILQLCAHKLERIRDSDSESNLRRSVCINNTYCRLTDELRREKQSRYVANLPKSDTPTEPAHHNIFNVYNRCTLDNSNQSSSRTGLTNPSCSVTFMSSRAEKSNKNLENNELTLNVNKHSEFKAQDLLYCHTTKKDGRNDEAIYISNALSMNIRDITSHNLDADLEILDRELNAINAPMPLMDPEITQGAEQLERAVSSRKRMRNDDDSDSDRLVREALAQFYLPPQSRFISAIEDGPIDVVSIGMGMGMGINGSNWAVKRQKISGINCNNDVERDYVGNQSHKEFEVIMDALRIGSSSSSSNNDSCGQAAMMMSESPSVFHNLVVTSLET